MDATLALVAIGLQLAADSAGSYDATASDLSAAGLDCEDKEVDTLNEPFGALQPYEASAAPPGGWWWIQSPAAAQGRRHRHARRRRPRRASPPARRIAESGAARRTPGRVPGAMPR